MSDRGRTSRLVRPLLVALLAALPVQAQIVTDGSVGSKVSLRGGKIEIGADLGTRRGANLFHSFEKFGITTGQTATFTGPVAIKNVISRVTGGEVSRIDGKLASTVGQADLYFLNPAGVMFGPNATLDVPGSFHVSTAHELRFADGVSFSALDKSGSGLTVAAPEAFGFLNRPPNRITVDQSQLQLKPGKTLSLVGGDLTIDGGETGGVGVEDGVVQLVSAAAPGTVRISDAATMVGQRGEVRVTQSADRSAKGGGFGSVDVSGRNSERTIRIRGGQVAVDGAWIFADNYGSPDSAGGIDVQADEILIRDGTVTADSVGPGKAGIVTVAAEKLELHGGLISSSTYGPGDAGQVTVNANRLLVGSNGTATFTNIKSSANTGSTGRAGTVAVTAREIELHGDDQTYGTIASSTFGYGNAGQVTVNADRLLISRDGAASPTRITSSAQRGSTGWAGAVTVTARELVLRNGGEITSNTSATGNAGQVTVNADRLLISRDGAATFTGIASSANTGSTGRAGMVAVIARELELHGGGQIHSITFGRGNAGQVTVNADRLLVSGTDGARYPSLISSQANDVLSGAAGSVAVTARAGATWRRPDYQQYLRTRQRRTGHHQYRPPADLGRRCGGGS